MIRHIECCLSAIILQVLRPHIFITYPPTSISDIEYNDDVHAHVLPDFASTTYALQKKFIILLFGVEAVSNDYVKEDTADIDWQIG